MPFSRRSSYTLTLAVIAAMPAILHAANLDPDIQNALWTCTMEDGQDWQCGHPNQDNNLPTATEQEKPSAEIKQEQPIKSGSFTSSQQINGTWSCEANAVGGWSCLDNTAPTVTSEPGKSSTEKAVAVTSAPLLSAKTLKPDRAAQADLTDRRHENLDWYPVSGATKACHGIYLEPESHSSTQLSSSLNQDKLQLDADRSETQLGGLTRLEGNVELRQQGRYLRSNSAQFDQISNQISMVGNVQYREPGMLLRGTQAQTNAISGETVVSHADYVVHERSLRGDASRIIRMQDNRIRMEESTYTTCPPNDESWEIAADSLVLDPSRGFGTARHATLRVADTPVFYFPYLEFPIDDQRHSGFLFPSFGYSNEDGIEAAIPYYFNLAPNFDDTLTPKVFTKRGLLLENEFRYLDNYGKQTLSTGLLVDDNQANRDRWALGLNHSGHKEAWSTLVDYNAISDDDYFDDLGSSLDVDRSNHLNQQAEVRYSSRHWSAKLRAHSYQTINNSKSPYQRMPQLQLEGSYSQNQGQEIVYSYLADTTLFDRKIDGLTGIDRVTGSRLHLQPSLSMPTVWSWGYMTPKVTAWLSQYNLEDQIVGQDDSISRAVGLFSFDSGLVFERQAGRYTQTLEPRLFALYSQEEDQQGIPDFDTAETDFSYQGLFRENRFTGLDKVGDNQQVSFGISSAFYRNDGSEKARLGLAQAYYFADRTVQLNGDTSVDTEAQSNFAAEASWSPYSDLQLSIDTELDKQSLDPLENNFKVRFTPAPNKAISFSYRYREEVRNQAEATFIWPLSPEWSAMGLWQKDLENSQTPEALLGLEYASCCWKVRVAARRWIEDDSDGKEDTALFLQFVLKGLGGIGNDSSALEGIFGFKEREENNDY
ncbi:LPS-assembly protein LptD [Amphritea japonica]|uniref:LPS-assembly protein LptD n=1 Tax=Amphritea japonica ATCC BAA-1530 TaxID=1278309 RepID=A0A7R6P163_9GAMM|nr:LPS-assembly protein LptD [Amphritea japonica]BBB25248.1 LPS-assembly protein [Amphritea japonica ATCC BAA-1530]